ASRRTSIRSSSRWSSSRTAFPVSFPATCGNCSRTACRSFVRLPGSHSDVPVRRESLTFCCICTIVENAPSSKRKRPGATLTGVIYNRIAVLRTERGLSRQELAAAIGVNYQTVGYLERGDYKPSLELALRLAEFFQLPVEAVFARQ